MLSITSADSNTCVGKDAGRALSTGSHNVIMGRDAGQLVNTGSYNVIIGVEAGEKHTTADYNTFVGYGAGKNAVTSGAYNTAIGRDSGRDITTGTFFTGVGQRSAENLETGTKNTCIGNYTASTLTTGNYNVVVGSDANVSNSDADGRVVIGESVSGTANNAVHIGRASFHVRNDFADDATWDHVSDKRMKTNIEDSTLGLSFINKLRPVIFNWKSPSEFPKEWDSYDAENTEPLSNNTKLGLIAQEVKEVIDELGIKHYDGTWGERPDGQQEIGDSAYIFPLIKAVQELSAEIKKLKGK